MSLENKIITLLKEEADKQTDLNHRFRIKTPTLTSAEIYLKLNADYDECSIIKTLLRLEEKGIIGRYYTSEPKYWHIYDKYMDTEKFKKWHEKWWS